ncbi:MAG: PAS domain-containing protein [Verrucomicrobiota bacterium]|jgi:PAS domain S-box-containing protein
MDKLTQLLGRRTGTTATLPGIIGGRVGVLLKRGQDVGVVSRALVTLIGMAFIGAIGWAGFQAAQGLSFEFIYLFICALVGWIAGAPGALLCAVESGSFLFLGEIAARGASPPIWILVCNSVVRLSGFAAIAWLAAKLGGEAGNLERKLAQRAASLEQETEEHKATSELLGEAIQLFTQVTENIADVFWVTDPLRRQFEHVSPGFETIWGRTCSALYASPNEWFDGIHPEDRQRVIVNLSFHQTRGGYDEEYQVVRPDGSLRWVHDRAFPVKDEHGAVYRLVGVAEDITERKLSEQLLQAERDLGAALSSTNDLGVALARLLEIAAQLEGIDCGGVYLLDAETGELNLQAHRGLSPAFIRRVSHYKSDATEARLIRAGKILYVRREQIPRSLEVLWGSEGLRALAIVPLQHKGGVVGMLNLGSYRQDDIPPQTRVGLETISSQVAGAIARIKAEESQRRSEAHLRTIINLAPIALIAVDAGGTITFEDGQALRAMGVKPGEHLRRAAAEVYADYPLMLENIRRALAGEEFDSILEFASTVFECRYTPLRDQDAKRGGFIILATDVTERSRLQRQILEISDREQARIGQDIHDGLCQQLIGMAFQLNALEQSLRSEARPEAARAQKMCALLDEAITESRRVCRGLYPVRLSTQGLLPALEELSAAAAEKYGIECSCEPDGKPPPCDVATATHLYRIAQEAVNNALKHSGARHIRIHLSRVEGGIVLEVRDDGRGLGPSPARHSGMGLHIMDYRARLIGGSLQLESGPNGTVVTCRVPQTL